MKPCKFFTDPAYGMHMYDELNEEFPVSGHSYNAADRRAGVID